MNGKRILQRQEYMLAVMATVGKKYFQPVHIQKLFFLLDQKYSSRLGGQYFNFKPYDYGPFDKEVYTALEELSRQGYVKMVKKDSYRNRQYRLTEKGMEEGKAALAKLPLDVSGAIERLTIFIHGLPFKQLVTTVYKEYPAMKEKSIFTE